MLAFAKLFFRALFCTSKFCRNLRVSFFRALLCTTFIVRSMGGADSMHFLTGAFPCALSERLFACALFRRGFLLALLSKIFFVHSFTSIFPMRFFARLFPWAFPGGIFRELFRMDDLHGLLPRVVFSARSLGEFLVRYFSVPFYCSGFFGALGQGKSFPCTLSQD